MRHSIDLSQARVLISNDDGIEADGLILLEEITRPLAGETWVSAPAEGHSGASAMVSLRREITVEPRGEHRQAVTGRPVDSLLAALRLSMADCPPDLVLSGINHGANIGGDLIYSGTVGVAMAAALNGVPAIAISADYPEGQGVQPETWADIRVHLPRVLAQICALGFGPSGAYGLNFPVRVNNPDPVFCRQSDVGDTMVYKTLDAAAGRYVLNHLGNGTGKLDGTDLGALQQGRIAITPLTLDRTDHALLDELRSQA